MLQTQVDELLVLVLKPGQDWHELAAEALYVPELQTVQTGKTHRAPIVSVWVERVDIWRWGVPRFAHCTYQRRVCRWRCTSQQGTLCVDLVTAPPDFIFVSNLGVLRGWVFHAPLQVSESPLPLTALPGVHVHDDAAEPLLLPAGHVVHDNAPELL